jgi:hypothetical protein
MKYFEKQAAFYHGHSVKNITKILKEGLPAGQYLARKRWISDLYAGQYKKGKTLRFHIPKELRKKYLTDDPANKISLPLFGRLNASMKRNKLVTKDIPTKFISARPMTPDTARPSIEKFMKELSEQTNLPIGEIKKSMLGFLK